jgi:membrane protein
MDASRHREMTRATRRFVSVIQFGGLTGRQVALRTWERINEHAILTRAAAIAFYAIAALIPFMGLLIALTAQWLPRIERRFWVDGADPSTEAVAYLLPEESLRFISHELKRLREQPPSGLISFSLAALVWLSSSVFVEIIDAMNLILGVRETRPFWKRRAIAIAMTISQAAILIVTTLTIIIWPQILKLMGLTQPVSLLATAAHGMSVVIMVLLSFALALHVGPDADQDWVWITPGSMLGAAVLVCVSVLFRIYVQQWANYSATYGSVAGMIGLMSWIWISSVVLLIAAELNRVVQDAS